MYNSYYEKILATGEVKCIDEEIPFEIPESWEWVRLNELGIYRKGPFGSSLTKFMFVPKSETTIKVYEQKNAIQKDYTLGEYYITQEKFQSMLSFIVKPLDIIVSCAGTIGESYVLPEDAPVGIINQALMRISLFKMDICDYYLLYFDYILKRQAQLLSSGSAIKNIPPFEILKNMLMPIPPLAEQKRILGRTDEIINAISKYELLKETLDKLDTDLRPQLKKSILQYAIQGNLVAQCDTDEPATDLLKRIHEENLNLVKQGKLKRKDVSESTIFRSDDNRYYEKVGSIVNDITDEIPYELPETWSFVRLSSICYLDDGIKHSGEKLPYMDAKFHRGKGDITYLTQGKIVEPPYKAILVDGENSGEIFNITERGYLGSTFKILRIANCISEEWLHLLLDAYRDVFKNSKVGAAIPHLNKNLFRNLIIGLPPYEEQIRITEKVLALQKSIEGV